MAVASAELPAGPRLPRVAQSLHYGAWPHDFFVRAWREHGDVFTVRPFGESWVVLADPDAARELYALGPDAADSGAANRDLRSVLGSQNVLLLDGDEHLRRRRLVLPPFHGEALRGYPEVIEQVAEREIASWPLGRAIPLLPELQAITFEVMLRAVYGVQDGQRLERLGARMQALLAWTTDRRRAVAFALTGPDGVERMPGYRGQVAALDAEILALLAERRDDPRLAERTDALALLLRARDEDGEPLTDRQLRDELVLLMVAGHETTAALLAWAVVELAGQPEAQERIAAGEPGFSEAVVRETLRLHPPVPLGGLRVLRRPARIGGHDMPAGAHVTPCALLIHRRPDLYPSPDDFRPDRFLGIRPRAGDWIPFGGGVRRCLGAALAELEARLVLEAITRRCALSPPPARRSLIAGRRGIVLVPEGGARVVLRAR